MKKTTGRYAATIIIDYDIDEEDLLYRFEDMKDDLCNDAITKAIHDMIQSHIVYNMGKVTVEKQIGYLEQYDMEDVT